ncbi:MAG: beta-lactamase family protein [Bacteroidales bacterium]|nr:beta-lactamase family protein [Bacteroidales bacterium]
MKKLALSVFLAASLFGVCRNAYSSDILPRGDESVEWALAAESFYNEAVSVPAPDKAQPYSIMVVDHGKVVLERCYGGYTADSRVNVLSECKTVLALAAGIAVEEGLFSVGDRVADFFPGHLPHKVSDTLSSMTIRHLLTMTCGWEESSKLLSVFARNSDKDFDWIGEFFASRPTSVPGTQFYYNFFASYIMAAIIEKTSGMHVMDYIRPRLLEPLDITDAEWEVSPAGICVGGWGMLLCTEDLAKLGQLLLQRGKWNGRQLVPEEWIDSMTSKQVESGPFNAFLGRYNPSVGYDTENEHSQGYGYYVWRGKYGTYRMEGLRGKLTIVSPARETVLVLTGDTNLEQEYVDLIWKHFAHLM